MSAFITDAERFLLQRDRAVQAGAGTGKTHALVTQYLHLVAGLCAHERPIEPRALLVLTFTDKAAGELVDRLRRRVRLLCQALPRGLDQVTKVEPELCQSAAALGGILIPIAIEKMKADPAIASGVFVTTVTDVTGFMSFLGIATLWFGFK